ncbi:hypothetical protein CR513_03540, partial [Mucuna pruriens]
MNDLVLFRQVKKSDNFERCFIAMKKEFKSMDANKVQDLVEFLKRSKQVSYKQVFKFKTKCNSKRQNQKKERFIQTNEEYFAKGKKNLSTYGLKQAFKKWYLKEAFGR